MAVTGVYPWRPLTRRIPAETRPSGGAHPRVRSKTRQTKGRPTSNPCVTHPGPILTIHVFVAPTLLELPVFFPFHYRTAIPLLAPFSFHRFPLCVRWSFSPLVHSDP